MAVPERIAPCWRPGALAPSLRQCQLLPTRSFPMPEETRCCTYPAQAAHDYSIKSCSIKYCNNTSQFGYEEHLQIGGPRLTGGEPRPQVCRLRSPRCERCLRRRGRCSGADAAIRWGCVCWSVRTGGERDVRRRTAADTVQPALQVLRRQQRAAITGWSPACVDLLLCQGRRATGALLSLPCTRLASRH